MARVLRRYREVTRVCSPQVDPRNADARSRWRAPRRPCGGCQARQVPCPHASDSLTAAAGLAAGVMTTHAPWVTSHEPKWVTSGEPRKPGGSQGRGSPTPANSEAGVGPTTRRSGREGWLIAVEEVDDEGRFVKPFSGPSSGRRGGAQDPVNGTDPSGLDCSFGWSRNLKGGIERWGPEGICPFPHPFPAEDAIIRTEEVRDERSEKRP